MIVTRIEPIGNNRNRIYLDEQLAFVLYKGELRRYKIREQEELPQNIYEEIMGEVLVKRAKLRCMNLLKSMDKTEYQLRIKLNQGAYPKEAVEQAIAYVKGYGYVDDERYASSYYECYKERKSRIQIQQELMRRGISRELLAGILEGKDRAEERPMIEQWIRKKRVDIENADKKELQKLYLFLMRKGFSSSEIKNVLRDV